MNSLIFFVLKSTSISAILFAYYWIALRNKNFNYYNRFYLLFSSIVSILLPLLNFKILFINSNLATNAVKNVEFLTSNTKSNESTYNYILSFLILTIVLISVSLIFILIINVYKIYNLKSKSKILKIEGVDFINTHLDYAPFTFLNNLFWKEEISLDDDLGQKIFKHEITHIQQKHTYDVLYSQIVCSIFWMNPINWLVQKELKTIHEFIADREAIGENNVNDFIELILKSNYSGNFLNPTNTFFYSSIKRRLLMLKSTNKTKYSYLRRVLILPISFCLFIMMSIGINKELRATTVKFNISQIDTLPKNSIPKALSEKRKAELKANLESQKKDEAEKKADLESQKKDEAELNADLEAQKKDEAEKNADLISSSVKVALTSAMKVIDKMNLDSIVNSALQTALKEVEKSKDVNAKKEIIKAMKEVKSADIKNEIRKALKEVANNNTQKD